MLGPLSATQEQVIRALCEGLTYEQTAVRIGRQHSTVRGHVSDVLRKFGLANATQACLAYVRRRAVSDEAIDAALAAVRATNGDGRDKMRAAVRAALDA